MTYQHFPEPKFRIGATPSCGFAEREDTATNPEWVSQRIWLCEGSMVVLRGNGYDYGPGREFFLSAKPCPKCGWKTEPWSRVFAVPVIGDPADTIREYGPQEQAELFETRGGEGDELQYDTLTDSFRFALGTGIAPYCLVTNPCLGDPLEGAKLVWTFADKVWEDVV